MILQDLGHIPHQGSEPAGLNDAVCLKVLKKPPKLIELHQLIVIIPGVKPPGACLRQCRRAQL
jgi:hypothetical protein